LASPRSAVDRVGRRVTAIGRSAAAERDAYANGADRPLGSYLVLLSTYLSGVATLIAIVRRQKRPIPERLAPADLALIAVGTHRLTRLVAKDSVTAAVRAPFTRFEEPAGEGEVNEQVRGTGLRHAVGELLTCPFCLAQWVATAFVFGLVLAPRATRLAASALVAVTASDVMQLAYAKLEDVAS
jgi:hypothetical protein